MGAEGIFKEVINDFNQTLGKFRNANDTKAVHTTFSDGTKSVQKKIRNQINNTLSEFTSFFNSSHEWYIQLPPLTKLMLLAAVSITLVIIILGLIMCICHLCYKKVEDTYRLSDKFNLHKDQLFGSTLAERLLTQFDELDYNLESTSRPVFDEIKLPQIRYSLAVKSEENKVIVTVHDAKNIPSADLFGNSDPFVLVMLIPASKKEFRTQVKINTQSPKYEETFIFNKITYAKFTSSSLILKVYDKDTLFNSFLGIVEIAIADLDLTKGKITQTHIFEPEFHPEEKMKHKKRMLGYICVAVNYSANTNILSTVILSCKRLPVCDNIAITSHPYVTLFLVDDGKKTEKRKTTVKFRSLKPVFNEAFSFEVDLNKIEDISLLFVVRHYVPKSHGEPIGQCIIGQFGQGLGQKQWKKVRKSPGKTICYWHKLNPIPEL